MIARIISIEKQPAAGDGAPPSVSHLHSKFVLRRKYVEEILKPHIARLGFQVELFKAVVDTDFARSGNTILYNDLRFEIEYGVVGCFLSHAMLWRLCVEQNTTLLVLEDDASLPAECEGNIAAALAEFDALADSGDILYLLGQLPYLEVGLHGYAPSSLTPVGPNLRRAHPVHDLSGTAAYAIKPKAAQRLLDRIPKKPIVAVDGYIHHAVNAREIGVIVPADFVKLFMLHEHFAPWNHIHDPSIGDL